MQRLEDTSTPVSVFLAIVGYSLCSSTLLLANKMAVEYLPSPSVISFVQIVFSTIAVIALKFLGYSSIDWFDWERTRGYFLYILIFVAAIYTNMKALASSNVETVIVFRACTPIAVSIVEYSFMNRELPNTRSAISLAVVAVGAALYCLSDSQLQLNGVSAYSWVLIYFALITVEMTYGKVLISSVKMNSVWGPVLYCNALSILPMLMMGYCEGGFFESLYKLNSLSAMGGAVILFSCIVGTLIGYTGWLCRGMVSATTYTLVGVVNKFLTVLLNVIVWDKHSSPFGISAVCLCLIAGVFYQQSPRRETAKIDDSSIELPETNRDPDAEDKQPLLSEVKN